MKKEDLYNTFNSKDPSEEQKNRMLNKILHPAKESLNIKPRRILIAAIILSLMTTTVIAANFSSFQNLIERLNTDNVKFMEPIEMISIDQGIKAEVVAVSRYGNMVKAYITIEDLEGDRLDRDFNFRDYASIRGSGESFRSSLGWSMVDYDEENSRATIFLEAERDSGFEGETLTFSFTNLFYGRKNYENYQVEIDLAKIDDNPSYINATAKQFMSGGGDRELIEKFGSDKYIVPILTPHNTDYKFPEMDSNIISSIGIIDGKLHVQIWRDDIEGEAAGYSLYLLDSKGERIEYSTFVGFMMDPSNNHIDHPGDDGYEHYEERIFDIDTDNLSEYKLFADYNTSERLTGDWKITFEAENNENVVLNNIDANGILLESLEINPFGLTLVSEEQFGEPVVTVNTSDEILEASCFTSFSSAWDANSTKDEYTAMYRLERPIDMNLIKSITINGVEIPIK